MHCLGTPSQELGWERCSEEIQQAQEEEVALVELEVAAEVPVIPEQVLKRISYVLVALFANASRFVVESFASSTKSSATGCWWF